MLSVVYKNPLSAEISIIQPKILIHESKINF